MIDYIARVVIVEIQILFQCLKFRNNYGKERFQALIFENNLFENNLFDLKIGLVFYQLEALEMMCLRYAI